MDRDRSIERSDRSRSESRSRSSSQITTNKDRIRCYRCRECDHFTGEYPTDMTDKESGHDESDKAALQILTQDNLIAADEQGQIECLNI